jgi:hypothetical protein
MTLTIFEQIELDKLRKRHSDRLRQEKLIQDEEDKHREMLLHKQRQGSMLRSKPDLNVE